MHCLFILSLLSFGTADKFQLVFKNIVGYNIEALHRKGVGYSCMMYDEDSLSPRSLKPGSTFLSIHNNASVQLLPREKNCFVRILNNDSLVVIIRDGAIVFPPNRIFFEDSMHLPEYDVKERVNVQPDDIIVLLTKHKPYIDRTERWNQKPIDFQGSFMSAPLTENHWGLYSWNLGRGNNHLVTMVFAQVGMARASYKPTIYVAPQREEALINEDDSEEFDEEAEEANDNREEPLLNCCDQEFIIDLDHETSHVPEPDEEENELKSDELKVLISKALLTLQSFVGPILASLNGIYGHLDNSFRSFVVFQYHREENRPISYLVTFEFVYNLSESSHSHSLDSNKGEINLGQTIRSYAEPIMISVNEVFGHFNETFRFSTFEFYYGTTDFGARFTGYRLSYNFITVQDNLD